MAEKKQGFFKRLVEGLSKTRRNIVSGLESVFMGVSTIDEDFYEELEEVMIMGDLGVAVTEKILSELRERVEREHLLHPADCKGVIIEIIKDIMEMPDGAYDFEDGKSVVFVIGVNGVGKTTSIGKLASLYRDAGKRVLVAAADTFRAAAIDQLKEWSYRANVPIVAQSEGSDPAAVVFDAVNAFRARNMDMLIVDTAGRLHNKKNLMEELRKMDRILNTNIGDAARETWLVLDATTGQNAISQAKEFMDVAPVTGIVLTKMDGTAKGGMVIAIQTELGIPVKFIGVGEKLGDLQKFDPSDFVDALFADIRA
ncbi:MAG: signal recognition particle-docking protein FtsY [Lachnospiraceae bacterium]|nr:signal recognition particle-docking protein FtsY [Lachnospiraceae bacterium]